MSQGQSRQRQPYHDLQYHMNHHVTMNTSSTQTHGTSIAAARGPLSSFQTPAAAAAAGQAVLLGVYARSSVDRSPVSSFASSPNQQTPVAAVPSSSSPETSSMGLGQSKSASSTSLPTNDSEPAISKGGNAAGIKFRRFGAKRKKSEDSNSSDSKLKESTTTAVVSPSSLTPLPYLTSTHSTASPTRQPPTTSSPSLNQILDKTVASSSSNASVLSPQQTASLSGRQEPSPHVSASLASASHPKSPSSDDLSAPGNRNSVIPLSPGITSAVNYMMLEWQQQSPPKLSLDTSSIAVVSTPLSLPSDSQKGVIDNRQKEKESVRRHSGGSAPTSPDKREMKESWRKSDSTNSHHTVRANSSRASRPVSWAESFHSAYTIVPSNISSGTPQGPSSKRLSGLITDADFGMPEEDLEDADADVGDGWTLPSYPVVVSHATIGSSVDGSLNSRIPDHPPPVPVKSSADSAKKANRRSISLSSALPSTVVSFLGGGKALPTQPQPPLILKSAASTSAAEVRKASRSISGMEALHNTGTSHPYSYTHLRQQSENLLHKGSSSPLCPSVPSYPVPSVSHSTSQPTSGSHAAESATILSPQQQASAAPNIKGKLHSFLPTMPRNEQKLPPIPIDSLDSPGGLSSPGQSAASTPASSHTRQPTISGLGPSAAGLAKRAVERMGKRWGDMMSGLSSASNSSLPGYSSSTSASPSVCTSFNSGMSIVSPPWFDNNAQQSQGKGQSTSEQGLTRTGSNSAPPHVVGHAHHHSVMHVFLPGPSKSGGHKRTPNAKSLGAMATLSDVSQSGASSSTLASASVSASTSDSDPFTPSGPVLGRLLRGPMKRGGKVVFGRELKAVVRDARVVVGEGVGGDDLRKGGLIRALEYRVLPAVVVRCAQHLLIWGVQEEGLFRVNGRPRHVSQLRAEFDAAADYDMTECSPGDLDPHAVASVFKAFLRELPDSILTHKLQPYFDAAINKENSFIASEQEAIPSSRPGKGLSPASKNALMGGGLRKPPSLSTLAMPSFSHVPPASKSLVNAIRSLIVKLPPENRDLIRTVVDLIKATARGSKATKMPLSNLLLLFCPSLNMSPPLLRVLCEAEGIWEEEERIIDITREPDKGDRIADSEDDESLPPLPPKHDTAAHDEDEVDLKSGLDEKSSLLSGRGSSDHPSSLDYHASAEEDSIFSEERAALPRRRRREIIDRSEVPTVYLDTRSHLSSSSASLLHDPPEVFRYNGSVLHRRDLRDDGSISSSPYSLKHGNLPNSPSPPPLSSSAESVSTPTSSANPSLASLPLEGNENNKDLEQKRHEVDLQPSVTARVSPQIVDSESMDLRKRPYISNPIPISGPVHFPFPTSQSREHVPPTPSRRRSIPLLSLSSLSSHSSGSLQRENAASGSPSSNGSPNRSDFRMKKPSLKLLFSKKSTSSLLDDRERPTISLPFLNSQSHLARSSPRTGSDSSSISTPLSAVTAPQASSCFLPGPGSMKESPPVLDTPIDDSSLKFDGLLDGNSDGPATTTPMPLSQRVQSSSSSSSSSSRSGGLMNASSPLKKLFVSPSSYKSYKSSRKSDIQVSPTDRFPRLQPSSVSLTLDHDRSSSSAAAAAGRKDEDWMRSVLIAADAALPSGSKLW